MEPLARGARFGAGAGAGPVPPSPQAAVQRAINATPARTKLRFKEERLASTPVERENFGMARNTGSPAGGMRFPMFRLMDWRGRMSLWA